MLVFLRDFRHKNSTEQEILCKMGKKGLLNAGLSVNIMARVFDQLV